MYNNTESLYLNVSELAAIGWYWMCPIQPKYIPSSSSPSFFLRLSLLLPCPSVYILLKLQEAIFKPVPQIEKHECMYVWVGGWVIVRDSGRGPVHHKQSF